MRKGLEALEGSHLDNSAAGLLKQTIGDAKSARDALADAHPDAVKLQLNTVDQVASQVGKSAFEGTAVSYLWRTGSATAHGYHWTAQLRPDQQSFDEEWFNTALYAAFMRLDAAFTLYKLRSTNHTN